MLVAVSAWLSKIASAGSQFVAINLITKYLGTDNYAIFSLLTGLNMWFMLGDMGLGFSMQNRISERRALSNDYTADLIVGFSIGLIAFVVLFLVLCGYSSEIGAKYLQQFSCLSLHKKESYFMVASLLLLATTFGGMIYKVWYAEQRGYIANLFMAIGSICSLIGVWLVVQSQVTDMVFWCLIAYLTPPMLLSFCAAIGRLARAKNLFKIARNYDEYSLFLTKAIGFWGLAAMSTFVLSVDMIVLSQYVTPQQIVGYTITSKFFGLAMTIYVAVLMALWPVCSELVAKDQWSEAIKLAKKHIFWGIALIVSITFLFGVLKVQVLRVMIGSGNEPAVSLPFILLMGCYHVIRVWTDTFSMLIQSSNSLRCLWLWVPIQGVINILLQILLVPRIGIAGIAVALIASFLLTVSWMLPVRVFSLRKIHQGILNGSA
jgi:O-antigen/teichoic acid export membrane protein